MHCNVRLWNDPDGLKCVRTEPHSRGHIYVASDAVDRHKEAAQDDQEERGGVEAS